MPIAREVVIMHVGRRCGARAELAPTDFTNDR
ncbi:MAG: hypothetical protein JWO26_1417 [Rhodospirillales bacterium]|nr:hypothetical protein [Rhodospirillales bacterium]